MYFDFSFESRPELPQGWDPLWFSDSHFALCQSRLVRRFNLSCYARIALFGGTLDALIVENEVIPVHAASFVDRHEFQFPFFRLLTALCSFRAELKQVHPTEIAKLFPKLFAHF